MIAIENLLLTEEDDFFNYQIMKNEIHYIGMKSNNIENFWSFLTENSQYIIGELVIEDKLISTDRRSIELLNDKAFFLDNHLWFDPEMKVKQLLTIVLSYYLPFSDLKLINKKLQTIQQNYPLKLDFLKIKYKFLNHYQKIILNILLTFFIKKEFNFINISDIYNDLMINEKKQIDNLIHSIIKAEEKTFIIVYIEDNEEKKDKDVKKNNKIQYITLNKSTGKSTKINLNKVFLKTSWIIFNIYKAFYITFIFLFFACITTFMVLLYSNLISIHFNLSIETISYLRISFLTLGIISNFVLAIIMTFMFKRYKLFIRNIILPKTIKITFFCYFYLIMIVLTLLFSNIFSIIIVACMEQISLGISNITYCIFTNVGFIVANLAWTSLWILIYNK